MSLRMPNSMVLSVMIACNGVIRIISMSFVLLKCYQKKRTTNESIMFGYLNEKCSILRFIFIENDFSNKLDFFDEISY